MSIQFMTWFLSRECINCVRDVFRHAELVSLLTSSGGQDFQPTQNDCVEEGETTQAGIAAVVSLILPDGGQKYNGDFLRGIFWLIVTPGLRIGSGGALGWICRVIAAYTAYSRGPKHMRGELGAAV